MEPAKIKAESLVLWAMFTGWFSFIPAPEARGAAVVASAFVLLVLAPALFFLGLLTCIGLVLFRSVKEG